MPSWCRYWTCPAVAAPVEEDQPEGVFLFGNELRHLLNPCRLVFEVQLLPVGIGGKVENRHPPLVRLKKKGTGRLFLCFPPELL